jgi:hypothetical protein
MEPKPRVCIDRRLPQDILRPFRIDHSNLVAFAIAPMGKEWINGSTLRVRFMGGTPEQHEEVRRDATQIQLCCNLKFLFNDADDAEIRITFDENDGAWSYVGTDCKRIPLNQPTMNLGWTDGGVILHELCHAVGLSHEHQNPQGGIQWNEQKVIADLSGPPNYWNAATIRHNVLEKYSMNQIRGTEFDKESIMLYAFPASWTMSGIATPWNTRMSETDRRFLNFLYPRPTAPTPVQPPPVVPPTAIELSTSRFFRTKAEIGNPGDEDLFTFYAEDEGNYRIDTKGPSDLVMRLYGPDNIALLVDEDDNDGLGKNALIERPLLNGRYWVQIRHADLSQGIGSYTIKANFKG